MVAIVVKGVVGWLNINIIWARKVCERVIVVKLLELR